MRYLLALDQGTSSSRALVFDEMGRLQATAQREFTQHFRRPGWVEHDPEEIWTRQLAVAQEAVARAGIDVTSVAAIGITNQRETVVVWDRATGRPVYPAIVWQDRRTAEACEALKTAGHEVPGAAAAAREGRLACGTIDSWLVWKLTGGAVHVTDRTNASRTLLCDIHCGAWDEELLALFGVPPSMLPDVVPSSGTVGYSATELLGAAIPIAGMAGDQQAALFGHGCAEAGTMKNTYGTGCFMLMCTGGTAVRSANRLLTTVACDPHGRPAYALEGSVFVAGAAVQWLRDGLGIISSSAEVEALARSVDDNGGVCVVPAFTGLGAPYWDAYARGAILGLTRGTTKGHIARATLESMAYQAADVLDAMHKDSNIPVSEVRVDGGATANDLLMQFQADILGVPVIRPQFHEMTALGAACLAGLGCGLWRPGDLPVHDARDQCFEPAMSADQRETLLVRWREAVSRSRWWA